MENNKLKFDRARGKLREVTLSAEEKRSMLASIYADKEPGGRAADVPSPFLFSFFFARQRMVMAVATMILIVSGTAYASSESLPGDRLYGMKVKVLEPASLAMRFEAEAKNEYQISLLQKRVREIEKLKSLGRLSTSTELASSRAAQQNVANLESSSDFGETGINVEVSVQIDNYNALVEEAFRLKTTIRPDIVDRTVHDPVGAAAATVEAVVEPIATPTNSVIETIEPTTKAVEETVRPVVEEVTAPIDNVVAPVIRNLGL